LGMVVGVEEGRVVVQLDGSSDVVLFHGASVRDDLVSSTSVMVWAWRKMLGDGAVRFLEGAAYVVREESGDNISELVADNTYDLLDVSLDTIFSPIRSQWNAEGILTSCSDSDPALDETFSVSFGSVSEHGEDEFHNSIVTDPGNSVHASKDSYRDFDEFYFNSLVLRSSSPTPDEIIDAQFDHIMVTNGIVGNNYDELIFEFDKLTSFDNTPYSPSLPHITSEISPKPVSVTGECLGFRKGSSTSPLVKNSVFDIRKFTRKLSYPPLSPIPEERICQVASDDVFFGSYLVSTPNGNGPSPLQSRRGADSITYHGRAPVSLMDSGYSDSFSSGTSIDAAKVTTRSILEQFLEFTGFPEEGRSDLITSFLVNTTVTDTDV